VPDYKTVLLQRAEGALALPGSKSISHVLLRAALFGVPIAASLSLRRALHRSHATLRRESQPRVPKYRYHTSVSSVKPKLDYDGRTALLKPHRSPERSGLARTKPRRLLRADALCRKRRSIAQRSCTVADCDTVDLGRHCLQSEQQAGRHLRTGSTTA